MPVLMFLKSVGEAVASRGLKGLMGLVPFGEQVYEIGKGTLEAYQRRSREAKIIADAEEMLQATIEEIKEGAKRISAEIGSEQNLAPEEIVQLESYLIQVPAVAKQSLKRPKDPSGTTIPVSLDLNNPVHVASILPKRPPKFKTGQAVPNASSYVFSEILGAGGFGEVWLAKHTFLDQARAFKFCLDPQARDRLLRHEGEIVKRVMSVSRSVKDDEHGIVPLVDAYLDGETPWLAYEYVDGGDLSSLVRELSTQPPQARSKVAIQLVINLAKIVGRFHQLPQAIIHRDLKPANVLLRKSGKGWVLRVTDFGISHVASQQGIEKAAVSTPSMNLGDTFRGAHTPIYASPQQKKGEKADVRDDVHALGVIGYQLLLGDLSAERPSGKWQKKFLLHNLPEGVLDLLGSCFDDDPDERPNDATDLAEKLRALMNPTPTLLPVEPVRPTVSSPPPPAEKPKPSFQDIEADYEEYLHYGQNGGSLKLWLDKNAYRKDRWQEGADNTCAPAMILIGECYEAGVTVPQSYETALKWYRKAADLGNAKAMNIIANFYLDGKGVSPDDAEALKWYRKAADLGYASSVSNIGWLYGSGRGVPLDYAEAIKWYRRAADMGSSIAVNNLGAMYKDGQGVPQDYAEALKFFRKSADLGHTLAMNNLGDMYEAGVGVSQDLSEAMKWYRKSADSGNNTAMHNLGLLYQNGRGVPQDFDEARKWYRKAADLGNTSAMIRVGLLFDNGQGGIEDAAEAMKWYRKAADLGEAIGMYNVGLLYHNGRGVAQDFKEAMKWYLKASDLGDALSLNNIGTLYENGQGVAQDFKEAMKWYRKAADFADPTSTRNIGSLHRFGRGVTQDPVEALAWFRKAADLGDTVAMNNIAWHYVEGKGVAQDHAEAMKWFRKGAELGNSTCINNIGALYEGGHGVKQDYREAMKWYLKAAEMGDPTAMRNIGFLYRSGGGVPQDYAEAMKWYRKAADLGHSGAMSSIGYLYENGLGVGKDLRKARDWYQKAADAGDSYAKERLKELK